MGSSSQPRSPAAGSHGPILSMRKQGLPGSLPRAAGQKGHHLVPAAPLPTAQGQSLGVGTGSPLVKGCEEELRTCLSPLLSLPLSPPAGIHPNPHPSWRTGPSVQPPEPPVSCPASRSPGQEATSVPAHQTEPAAAAPAPASWGDTPRGAENQSLRRRPVCPRPSVPPRGSRALALLVRWLLPGAPGAAGASGWSRVPQGRRGSLWFPEGHSPSPRSGRLSPGTVDGAGWHGRRDGGRQSTSPPGNRDQPPLNATLTQSQSQCPSARREQNENSGSGQLGAGVRAGPGGASQGGGGPCLVSRLCFYIPASQDTRGLRAVPASP